MKKYTIEDLREGRVALKKDSIDVEILRKIIDQAFPEGGHVYGGAEYYYKSPFLDSKEWDSTHDLKYSRPNMIYQSAHDFQLEMEEGKYYYVEDEDFWMIGLCKGNFQTADDNDKHSDAVLITSDKTLNKSRGWCYQSEGNEDESTPRTYRPATQDEIEWLDACIEAGKYMEKDAIKKYTQQDWIDGKCALVWDSKYSKEINDFFQSLNAGNSTAYGILKYYISTTNSGYFSNSSETHLPKIDAKELLNLEKSETMNKTIQFTPEQQQSTIDMACANWKLKLAQEFGQTIALRKNLEVTESRFKEYLAASTPEQLEKFKDMFTEYFQPEIKQGQLIYVRESEGRGLWQMRFFSNWKGKHVQAFVDQKKEGGTYTWDEYSLTNPLEEK